MDATTIRIPVKARMQYIDGEWRMTEAEYADIPVEAIAKRFLGAFGVPFNDEAGPPFEGPQKP